MKNIYQMIQFITQTNKINKMKKILISHPTGNANVRATVNAFSDDRILHSFFTSIALFKNTLLYKISNFKMLSELKKREFDISLDSKTKLYPFKELGRILSIKLNKAHLIRHEEGLFCIDKVYRYIDVKVAKYLKENHKKGITAVYAYEDCALESFKTARKLDVKCYYDLPIGYWKSARILLEEEKEKNPKWAATLTGFLDSNEKLKNKDIELSLASHIFVASSFTADTLRSYSGELSDITVVPYGFPKVVENREYNRAESEPIKLLFVGGLSQRKGISYLFEAAELLKGDVELTIVGNKAVENCEILNDSLEKYNWIPSLPHDDILKLMKTQDILVFPSLFEGFGLVVTEAMSQGTPVITTERTCGPDFIVDGKNGWLVEAGSTESLVTKLKQIIETPDKIEEVGREALITASKRPWSNYGDELVKAINEL